MMKELFETLSTWESSDLIKVVQNNPSPMHNYLARRILKDRLEGLDEVVKSEALHDKIVSA
jgi:hypothetical protein